MIVYDMPEVEYHARPELSSTGARLLLKSAKKFRWEQEHPRHSDAFDLGSAVHAKVLGVGSGVLVYPEEHLTPSGGVSTKKATRDWQAEKRAEGWALITPDSAADIDAMAEAVLAHKSARALLEIASHREVTVLADVDGVPSRARFDALSDETRSGVFAVDLKTTLDASRRGFEKSAGSFRYDVQQAWYEDVYLASEGRPVDQFSFILVEKSGPFEVAVWGLPDQWREIARARTDEARRIYRECVASGVWPGYPEDIQIADTPMWIVFEHEEQYEVELKL